MLEVKATAKYLRTSAQKAGLVLALIRGKKAADALAILRFTKKSIARDVEKTLRSAIANAVNVADKNQKRRLDEDDLMVSAAYADQGPTQKRVRPAPMGRAYQVLRRTTHITVCVAEKEEGASRAAASPKTPGRGSSAARRSARTGAEQGRKSQQESK
jgi:large subunit ribosomal protein L22